MTTKKVHSIGSTPRLPNWAAAAAAVRDGKGERDALCALLGIEAASADERWEAVLNELSAQRSPAISIYDHKYTAHIYPEPDVSDGQVYEAMRDYAAQHATEDPAMREVKRKQILDLLDQWKAEGPPSAEDDRFWREFQADLAKTKRGDFTEAAEDLRQQLTSVQKLLERWQERLPATNFQAREELETALGGGERI